MTLENNKNMPFAQWPHVLVVDDDARIRDLLMRYLGQHGFVVAAAEDAKEARAMLERFIFDVLVVDIMMPGETGVEFTRNFTASKKVPVLLLTAMGEGADRIAGLEAGADDYLVKPFEPKELVLRLNAILRRTVKPSVPSAFKIGNWMYDPESNNLSDGKKTISLTSAEVTLVEVLASYKGEVVDRETLALKCGVDPAGRTIDVQITRLRRKIEEDTANPKYLRTVRGKGYMLRIEEIE